MDNLIAIGLALLGLLSIVGGSYMKGRKDKSNESKADDLKVMQDAKERAEDISSASDDDFAARVRESER